MINSQFYILIFFYQKTIPVRAKFFKEENIDTKICITQKFSQKVQITCSRSIKHYFVQDKLGHISK